MRAAAIAVALSACVPDNGPLMRPGEDCMACHGGVGSLPPGERVRHAKAWTVAGTVFDAADANLGAEGAQVQITDASGWSFSLRANLAGNFYTREGVQFPLRACVERNRVTTCQQSPVTSGTCNSCHAVAPPPLTAP